MTPEQQQQFNAELTLVIAVASQVYLAEKDVQRAVEVAAELIKEAELTLKEHYEPKESPQPSVEPQVSSSPSRETLMRLISESSQILLKKGIRTQEELIGMLGETGVKRKEDLTDAQAEQLYNRLKGELK